jgi:hypothetical protein
VAEDVLAEFEFFAPRKSQRKEEKRRNKAKIEARHVGPSMIGDNDKRWPDIFLTSDSGSDDDE